VKRTLIRGHLFSFSPRVLVALFPLQHDSVASLKIEITSRVSSHPLAVICSPQNNLFDADAIISKLSTLCAATRDENANIEDDTETGKSFALSFSVPHENDAC
jgi:hypothetical protein